MMISKKKFLITLFSGAAILFAALPTAAGAQNLGDDPKFQALYNYVNVFLASKDKATAQQKENYHQGITIRVEGARQAVQQRFLNNRQNAWDANRRVVENYKTSSWPSYQAVIAEIRASYQLELISAENMLNEEIRMLEDDWDPIIDNARERLRSLAERRQSIKSKRKKAASKKSKIRVNKALKNNSRAINRLAKKLNSYQTRRDIMIAEARNLYNGEVAVIKAAEASEIQAERAAYRDDWQGFDLEMKMEFTDLTVPVLAERRDAEYRRVDHVRDRGRELIKNLK